MVGGIVHNSTNQNSYQHFFSTSTIKSVQLQRPKKINNKIRPTSTTKENQQQNPSNFNDLT